MKSRRYFDSSGMITDPVKIWVGTVTPSTCNGYSIDISSAGFSTILSANIVPIKSNSTANLNPSVAIKSVSTTAIVVNVVEGNAATVVILGSSVTLGVPLVFAATAGLTLYIEVTGY